MPPLLKLKKYANRRIYDTEKSAYITLQQLADAVRAGRTIEVRDAKSGEDVTAFILTQIILEESRKKNALLPVPLLHLIIRYGDNLLADFFDRYLQRTLKVYLDHKRAVDDSFAKWLEMGTEFSEKTRQSMEMVNPFQRFFDGFASTPENGSEDG